MSEKKGKIQELSIKIETLYTGTVICTMDSFENKTDFRRNVEIFSNPKKLNKWLDEKLKNAVRKLDMQKESV